MVECRICWKTLKRLNHRHLETHYMTVKEYRVMFPDAEVGPFPIAGWNRGKTMNFGPERGRAISKALKGRDITWGDTISRVKKQQCEDPEYALKLVSNINVHARDVSPTKPEKKLMAILDEHFPEQWKFVGNGELALGRLVPDFMNVDGKKQLIEVFGTYWHRGENPQKKIDRFAQYGFSTVVIWEHEVDDVELVLNRIANFPSVETLHQPPKTGEDKVRHCLKEQRG